MKKIRIGNDIVIKWRVTINGEEVNLEGLDLSLYISTTYQPRKQIAFTVAGNEITATFKGVEQKVTGVYRLTLYRNEGENAQSILDACDAFELVSCSCLTVDAAFGGAEVELPVADLGVGIPGLSAYEIAVAEGYEGTQEEWLASLSAASEAAAAECREVIAEFSQAEDSRVTAEAQRVVNENSRIAGEESRKEAEANRAAAEQLRAAAESKRDTAEQARIANETARQTAEQNRANAEANRKTAENARKTAEDARIANESTRQTNEQARVTAETSRESAETDRANAEAARVEAEQARAEEFAGFTVTLAAKEDVANKVTSINADADDVHYPSAKAVKDKLTELEQEIRGLDIILDKVDISDSLGNGERRWIRMPRLVAGVTYNMAISIKQASEYAFYWTLYTAQNTSSEVITYGTTIAVGSVSAEKTFVPSANYDSVYLMLFTQGNAGGYSFHIEQSNSIEKRTQANTSDIASNKAITDKRIDMLSDGFSSFNPSAFVRAAIYSGVLNTSVKYNVSSADIHFAENDIVISHREGFKFIVVYYNADGTYKTSSAWVKNTSILIEKGTYYRLRIEREPAVTSEVADIAEFVTGLSYTFEKGKDLASAIAINPFREKRILHHLNVENGASDIPSQSLHDIVYAKALGANMIEANVHKCRDGVYVVKHGSDGKLGTGLSFADSSINSDTLFSSVDSTTLRTKVSYNTPIQQFTGHIPTLDEFCAYASEVGIMVCLQCVDDGVLPIARKYLSDDRICAYGIPSRGDFAGIVTEYRPVTSASQALSYAKKYGPPYVLCWQGVANADELLVREVTKVLHENGYLVSGAYINTQDAARLFSLGIDSISSTFIMTNDIEHGNSVNAIGCDDATFVLTDATINSNGISMQNNGTVIVSDEKFAKGYYISTLRIKYRGKLTICVSSRFEDTYRQIIERNDDGEKYLIVSNASQRAATLLLIKSIGETQIEDIQFFSSRVM